MMIAYYCPALSDEPLYFVEVIDGEPRVTANLIPPVTDAQKIDAIDMVLRVAASAVGDMQTIRHCNGNLEEAERQVIRHMPPCKNVVRKVMEAA